MKKKILAAVLFILTVCVITVSKKSGNFSKDILVDNAEALANSESGSSGCFSTGPVKCYGNYTNYSAR